MFAPHSFPGVKPGPNYSEGAQQGITVAVQIESRPGVENVEKIAAVPGIDVVFIGPFDLAMQMGVNRGGQEHEAAIQRILAAAHNAGKKAAIFCMSHLSQSLAWSIALLTLRLAGTDGNDARVRAEQGFDMISVTTDVGVIRNGMQNELKTANGEN